MFGGGFGGGGHDPFAQMDRMMNEMMGGRMGSMMGMPPQMQMMGMPSMGFGMGMDGMGMDGMGDMGGRRRHIHQPNPDGPIIEEIDDDDNSNSHHRSSHNRHLQRHQPGSFQSFAAPGLQVQMFGGGDGMQGSSFSFSSSSVMAGGNGQPQVLYSSSSRTSLGPGGVLEHQEQVRDGRSGTERVTIKRGLGDRARTITKCRDAEGQEETIDCVDNIDEHEASQFDAEWRAAAARQEQLGIGGFGAPAPQAQRGGYAPPPRQIENGSRSRSSGALRTGAYPHSGGYTSTPSSQMYGAPAQPYQSTSSRRPTGERQSSQSRSQPRTTYSGASSSRRY
mmetsp:Transcript_1825/g.4086  ORF Transcript_1825/g.4086 Transcript_1825/m.4086 type:complete len:335 (+) Transcript_1825:38-1042(+)|eukprot:CAMPEP_0114555054 /NCGR_PEP_ID=MMETSP0114-20121206/8543_1 /TAXON_ID=31324 /ORGANISM="Goniomonas sp, Strain m" /LENGTH=334 /DNA_ID=CAMNT_0001740151 /DNA_START=29 /DNA_END=1033 /DNA_ORIENTATION=-